MAIPPRIVLLGFLALAPLSLVGSDRPNILWITSEDNGPHLGCYGDEYANSPHLDALAAKSLRYTRASSSAPVCAPARTTVISGIYPPASGSENMRSLVPLPDGMKFFPAYLREAGWYCTNNSKEDYNLSFEGKTWDESSRQAHWKNRGEGQPFFAVFNSTISHESKIRDAIPPERQIHDPAGVRVPAYHPDTPEVRRDWAQYYDRITMMDEELGERLREVEEAGLAEDTIVLYWGDHGSGMPRSKRWPYNSGLHVPFILHVPEKWTDLAPKEYAVGGESARLVSFLDLAPTMLSLAGLEPKPWMQGRAFAGTFEVEGDKFSHGFRGRMDERVDLVRSVLGERYVYLRHYMPHRIYGQYIDFMFQTPTTRVWRELFDAGRLNDAQSHFWREKPAEELYDLETDPDEVINLVDSPEHAEILAEMRAAHESWTREVRDIGFLPEAEIHKRSGGGAPYDMGQDPERYDFDTVFAAAQRATSREPADLPAIVEMLTSKDGAVRYWGATGLLVHGRSGYEAGREALLSALDDESGPVSVVAAESLGRYGDPGEVEKALDLLLARADLARASVYESILALNAVEHLRELFEPRLDEIRALPRKPLSPAPRADGYVPRLLDDLVGKGE